jgi:hypothetical protein
MRISGFTQALDPQFAAWKLKATESMAKTEFASNTPMPSGHTLEQERALTLRAQVKAACGRLHGAA